MTSLPIPTLRAILHEFAAYLRRPEVLVPDGLRSARGWQRWGWLTGLLIVGLIGVTLPFISLWQAAFDLPSADAFAQYPKAWLVPTVALIAPVIEELLFRGWQRGSASSLWLLGCALVAIGAVLILNAPGQALIVGAVFLTLLIVAPIGWWLLRRKAAPLGWFARAFPWTFYLVAVGFAAAHLSNYPKASLIALPMVLPQLWAGLVLGHIRQRIGLAGSILAHVSANSCTLALALLGGG